MTKRIAHKTTVGVDDQGGSSFTNIGHIFAAAQPGRSRDIVLMTCLEDDVEDERPSPINKIGTLNLSLFYDDADTDHLMLETIADRTYDDVANPLIVSWQFEFRHGATVYTRTMPGWISELGETNHETKTEITRDLTIIVTAKPIRTSAAFGG